MCTRVFKNPHRGDVASEAAREEGVIYMHCSTYDRQGENTSAYKVE